MATGDETTIDCPCSCGKILEGVQVETDTTWETHVKDGSIHLQEGHTVTVRGKGVTWATVALSGAVRREP